MRQDEIYLRHIVDSISAIEGMVREIDKEEFKKDRKTASATIRELEIIGEAATKVSPEFKEKHSEIPWRDIIDTRNKLIHEYFGVDLEIVWKVIKEDLPILKKEIEKEV